jgi:hypothetical protein
MQSAPNHGSASPAQESRNRHRVVLPDRRLFPR